MFDNDGAYSNELNLYKTIINERLNSAFPNVEIMLRLMIANANRRMTILQVECIKNDLRSSVGQDGLAWLSLMSIECEIIRSTDFSNLINEFRFPVKEAQWRTRGS